MEHKKDDEKEEMADQIEDLDVNEVRLCIETISQSIDSMIPDDSDNSVQVLYAATFDGELYYLARNLGALSLTLEHLLRHSNTGKNPGVWRIQMIRRQPPNAMDLDQMEEWRISITKDVIPGASEDPRLKYSNAVAISNKTFNSQFSVLYNFDVNPELIHSFLFQPNTQEKFGLADNSHVSDIAASWRMAQNGEFKTHLNEYKELPTTFFEPSTTLHKLQLDASKRMNLDGSSKGLKIHFNDFLYAVKGGDPLDLKVKPVGDGSETRPSDADVTRWAHILQSWINCRLDQGESVTELIYLLSGLFIALAFADPQGLSNLLLLSYLPSRKTRTKLIPRPVSKQAGWIPLERRLILDSKNMWTSLEDEEIPIIIGFGGLVHERAPLLWSEESKKMVSKKVVYSSLLFPLVLLNGDSLTTTAVLDYPYRTIFIDKYVANQYEHSALLKTIQRQYLVMLRSISTRTRPNVRQLKIVPMQFLGMVNNVMALKTLSIFPHHVFEKPDPLEPRSYSHNVFKLRPWSDEVIKLFGLFKDINHSFSFIDFVAHGGLDQTLAYYHMIGFSPLELDYWFALMLKAVNTFYATRASDDTERLNFITTFTQTMVNLLTYHRVQRIARSEKTSKWLEENVPDLRDVWIPSAADSIQAKTPIIDFPRSAPSTINNETLRKFYDASFNPSDGKFSSKSPISPAPNVLTIRGETSKFRWFTDQKARPASPASLKDTANKAVPANVQMALKFSLFSANELDFDEVIKTATFGDVDVPIFLAHEGRIRPLYHTMIPFRFTSRKDHNLLTASQTIIGPDYRYSMPLDTPRPGFGTVAENSLSNAMRLQLLFMLYPQNYAFLHYLANAEYENVLNLISIEEDREIKNLHRSSDIRTMRVSVLNMSGFQRNRTEQAHWSFLSDTIMAAFVAGLGEAESLNPGSVTKMKFYTDTRNHTPLQKVYLHFLVNPQLKDSTQPVNFQYAPGFLTFTEAARIGIPQILDLIVGNCCLRVPMDSHLRIGPNTSKEFLTQIKNTRLPECYYTLKPPYRLMTPYELLNTHREMNELPDRDAQVPDFTARTWDAAIAIHTIIELYITFNSNHTNKRLKFDYLQSFNAQLDKGISFGDIPRPSGLFYTDYGTDLRLSTKDAVEGRGYFLPRGHGEKLSAEERKFAGLNEFNNLDEMLLRVTSQVEHRTDVDRLIASHSRMWVNANELVMIASYKQIYQSRTQIPKRNLSDAFLLPVVTPDPPAPTVSHSTLPLPQTASVAEEPQTNVFDEEGSVEEIIEFVRNPRKEVQITILTVGEGREFEEHSFISSAPSQSEEEGGGERESEDEPSVHPPNTGAKTTAAPKSREEKSTSASEMTQAARRFPPVQTLATLENTGIWFDDLANVASPANVILAITARLHHSELRHAKFSYASALAIPLLLGRPIVRLRKFIDQMMVLSSVKQSQRGTDYQRDVFPWLNTFFVGARTDNYAEQILQPLAIGLELMKTGHSRVNHGFTLSFLDSALLHAVLAIDTSQREDAELVKPQSIERWMREGKLPKLIELLNDQQLNVRKKANIRNLLPLDADEGVVLEATKKLALTAELKPVVIQLEFFSAVIEITDDLASSKPPSAESILQQRAKMTQSAYLARRSLEKKCVVDGQELDLLESISAFIEQLALHEKGISLIKTEFDPSKINHTNASESIAKLCTGGQLPFFLTDADQGNVLCADLISRIKLVGSGPFLFDCLLGKDKASKKILTYLNHAVTYATHDVDATKKTERTQFVKTLFGNTDGYRNNFYNWLWSGTQSDDSPATLTQLFYFILVGQQANGTEEESESLETLILKRLTDLAKDDLSESSLLNSEEAALL